MVFNITGLAILSQAVANNTDQACPCVNTTSYLQNVTSKGDCRYNEMLGQLLKTKFPCVNATYGTGCDTHDFEEDPKECLKFQGKKREDVNEAEREGYDYCTSKWCYVDFETCYKSKQEMAGSAYFPGLFYSYTTCGNDDADFHKYASTKDTRNKQLTTTIPGSRYPFHYKVDENNQPVTEFAGSAYYDQTIPYSNSSVIMNYLNQLSETTMIVKNNVTFKYQPRSGGSKIRSPDSSFTGAVTDVQAGISDMAAAMFWITSERLSMTTFTVPLFQAGLLLYEPMLEEDDGLFHSARQMFKPFHTTLWILLCVFVVIVGILNVWFSSRTDDRNRWQDAINDKKYQNAPFARRFVVYSQLFMASILDSFVQCFGGGVSLDSESTFPSKILAFGFGFFVLISISSYTANLTSFLTSRAQNSYITSMDVAVSRKVSICAAPVLKSMLKTKWKGAKFYFLEKENGAGFDIIEAAKNVALGTTKGGKCDAMLVEKWVIKTDKKYNELFCEKKLITTNVKALDLNIAFPIREEYSAGISHYIKKLEQNGTFFEQELEKTYVQNDQCELEVDTSTVENEQMTVSHMFVPICVLAICILIACCLKAISKKKPAVFQAYDKTLELAEEEEEEDEKKSGGLNGSPFTRNEPGGIEKYAENGGSTDSTTNGSAKLHDFHDHLAIISQDVVKLTQDMKQRNV